MGHADGQADEAPAYQAEGFDVQPLVELVSAEGAEPQGDGTYRQPVDGLTMLLHRTVRQVELLTGLTDVPVAAMRGAAHAELVRRAAREAEPAVSG